jgi:phenylalanyl-tRNA synthetase beta chain
MPHEERRVAGVVSGARRPPHWSDGGTSVDFDRWDVKSLFEDAARAVGLRGTVVEEDGRWVLRGQDGEARGWADELDADRPAWAAPLFGFELLAVAKPRPRPKFESLPATPPVERDIALVLPADVTAGQVEEILAKRGGKLLESTHLFDEFRGKDLRGRSVAWRLVFRSPDRTLRDKDVDAVLSKILKELKEQLGVERRAG